MTDLVDIPLVAQRLGVSRNTVDIWRSRDILPPPDYPNLSRPLWDWTTIEDWAVNTNRLKSA